MRSASAMTSALSMPMRGLKTGISATASIDTRFSSVCEATWPMASPVTSALLPSQLASRSAMRSIRRR